jgi:hypothetical protein
VNKIGKQKHFTVLVARLIQKAYSLGYEVTFGEAWRPPETAKLYELDGRGIEASLHTERLAIDLNLFLNGVFLRQNEDYQPLGLWWETQSTLEFTCAWGGRFGDGNHFSIEHNGVK